ncbi:MAG: hypothetical protein QOH96_32, partial [Blastocatellia bacterium]|nr:hypothetical protein [Blastocatellia bacterium]
MLLIRPSVLALPNLQGFEKADDVFL